eukprot:6194025-Pleurochrysis_carterae.AAC.1
MLRQLHAVYRQKVAVTKAVRVTNETAHHVAHERARPLERVVIGLFKRDGRALDSALAHRARAAAAERRVAEPDARRRHRRRNRAEGLAR